MNTKDIEEYAKQRGACYAGAIAGYVEEEILDIARKLTQHHEAEVERGVKKGKIQALHIMEDLYAKADDKADLMEMVNEAILTPTKTDNQ